MVVGREVVRVRETRVVRMARAYMLSLLKLGYMFREETAVEGEKVKINF